MTSAALLQRAAELVIAFGLEHADATVESLRDPNREREALIVAWRLPCDRGTSSVVELVVTRRTASLTARVNVRALGLSHADATRVAELYGRVAALAERIEELR